MSGLVLLIIGLASLALVLAMLVYVGLKAWGTYKHGMRVYGNVAPFTDRLSDWSIVVTNKAQDVGETVADISVNVERLRASLQRLQILASALSEGAAPYLRLLHYLGR